MTKSSLQLLLGDLPKQQFVSEYLHRLPFTLPYTAREFCSLGNWDILGNMLQQSADVMVVRRGERHGAADPQNVDQARSLCDDGCTILVRHAEQHDDRLRQLASSFEDDLHAPVNIHMYVTPPGVFGFSWHYDAEDVFIIQTCGAKEYSLRKNTVNPWPLEETIPHDMQYERELMPLMRVELRAGDWLYIPCGYWHKADALPGEQAAISLAVGIMSPAAINLIDFLRSRLVESILWRQRLPITGDASPLTADELDAQVREICEQLLDELCGTVRSSHFPRQFREWYARGRH